MAFEECLSEQGASTQEAPVVPTPHCWRSRWPDGESRARRSQCESLGEQRGSGRSRVGAPPSPPPPSFSLRAFYLERSNLPTDASTTAVKIDQVCPPSLTLLRSLGRAAGCCQGQGAADGAQGPGPAPRPSTNPGREAPEASVVPPPGISLPEELLPHSRSSSFLPTHLGIP